MISFASVNAVLFTPALPDIATFFAVTDDVAQYIVSWFLIGYAIGQLLYGPLASRFGRKNALYIGIVTQIIASLGCVLSGLLEVYPLLVLGRFIMALGSGVGLKMTFTLVNECYEPKVASQKISYLMLAFAITPGLGVAIGGMLNAHYGWMSCFVGGAIYGALLLWLITRLPNIESVLDTDALKWPHLKKAYGAQLKNSALLAGGLLMGGATCFVYVFAALAPFIAMNMMNMNSEQYGMANIIPSIGLIVGSLCSAQLIKRYSLGVLIKAGLGICALGSLLMVTTMALSNSAVVSLFLPMVIIYIGISFVLANASTMAMSYVNDKAQGSAVMNFINMGLATIVVLGLGLFSMQAMLLPVVYLGLCVMMVPVYYILMKKRSVIASKAKQSSL